MNSDEEIDYISTIESTRPPVDLVPQDEADLPVLKSILREVDGIIEYHKTIDSIRLDDKVLTVEQQVTVNKAISLYMGGFKMAIEKVIDDVREKYSGR